MVWLRPTVILVALGDAPEGLGAAEALAGADAVKAAGAACPHAVNSSASSAASGHALALRGKGRRERRL
jgi:hypothetical protein